MSKIKDFFNSKWGFALIGLAVGIIATVFFANRHIAKEEKEVEETMDKFMIANPNATMAELKEALTKTHNQ